MNSESKNSKRAVFLDRDGVLTPVFLIDGKPYATRTLEEFVFLPGIEGPLETLHKAGFILLVATNQPDIARKKMTLEVLLEMNRLLLAKLGASCGVRKVYFCPHDDPDHCDCRKPKPGLLLRGAEEWGIDLKQSFMIGDRGSDAEAGRQAGCKTILLNTSYNQDCPSDYRASNLDAAVRIILTSVS